MMVAIPTARSRNTGLNSDELIARDLFQECVCVSPSGLALEFLVPLGPFIHLVVAENNYSTCRVWLTCVSLNWTIYFLVVFVSVVSCRSYVTSSI